MLKLENWENMTPIVNLIQMQSYPSMYLIMIASVFDKQCMIKESVRTNWSVTVNHLKSEPDIYSHEFSADNNCNFITLLII